MRPIVAIVPYHRNADGLAVTLAILQAQIIPPKAIVVLDTSPGRSGLQIARRYATHQTPLVVEVAPHLGIYEAWNRGLDLAGEEDVAILNDDLLLPLNFIDVLSVARAAFPALAYAPVTPPKDHYREEVDVAFPWWSEVPEKPEHVSPTDWLPGFCFLLTQEAVRRVGRFDEGFKVWFGDDDYQERLKQKAQEAGLPAILRINTLYVYHYGGASYRYRSKEVQEQIDKDRKAYLAKYNQRGPEVGRGKEGESD